MRIARLYVLFFIVTAGAGCGGVPAYARGRLAHPSMSTADPAGVGEQHVRAIHEGAVGGGFEAGGGCGCN
ncbi:MAG: DUF4266 domain-containing protein [Polyangiales bacterium]